MKTNKLLLSSAVMTALLTGCLQEPDFEPVTADGALAVIGNFSNSTKDITAWLPASGQWKDYSAFGSGSYNVTTDNEGHNSIKFNLKPGEFRLIVKN